MWASEDIFRSVTEFDATSYLQYCSSIYQLPLLCKLSLLHSQAKSARSTPLTSVDDSLSPICNSKLIYHGASVVAGCGGKWLWPGQILLEKGEHITANHTIPNDRKTFLLDSTGFAVSHIVAYLARGSLALRCLERKCSYSQAHHRARCWCEQVRTNVISKSYVKIL